MKNNILIIALLSTLTGLVGCKDDIVYTKYEEPDWTQVTNDAFSVNMTGILALPDNLQYSQSDEDKMAAFIGDECRSIAEIVDGNFYFTIKGEPDEEADLVIKYYAAATQYLYESVSTIEFVPDAIIGTSDEPLVIEFETIN